MTYVLIIHAVQDYDAWKTVFDEAADMRRKAGEVSYQVLSDRTDANRIVHFSRWTDLRSAQRFFESPELIAIRARAGVKAPDFNYLYELEAGIL